MMDWLPPQYTYLFLNLGSLFFPFVLSFDRKVAFFKEWWRLFPGIIVIAAGFIIWDEWFTQTGVWSFNPEYLTGIFLGSLPLEEWMFFFTIPYACMFIYACLKAYFPKLGSRYALPVIGVFSMLSAALAIGFFDRIYTVMTFGLLPLLWGLYLAVHGTKHAGYFLLMWLIHLIPFFTVNGVLTSWPVVIYNDAENLGFRIGTVPFEDSFYSMVMLLGNVIIYEALGVWKKRAASSL